MVYRCKDCVNRNNCPENKEQYTRLGEATESIIHELDTKPEYHCWFSFTLKCDYYIHDTSMNFITGEKVTND